MPMEFFIMLNGLFSALNGVMPLCSCPQNNQCQQMIIFLRDTSAADLLAIIEFMYKGSVNVCQTQLASFIKTAEMLQIKGLSGDDDRVRTYCCLFFIGYMFNGSADTTTGYVPY